MFYAVKISSAIRKTLLRWQRVPAYASSCRPQTLVSLGTKAAPACRAWRGRGETWAAVRTKANRHGCNLSSSPSIACTLYYQILQATLQITHLAQISPVSAHLTVMLLMFYFTVTPNLGPYCTMFCHLRCKINKEEGTDYCVYKGKLKCTVSVTAFSSLAWQAG